MTKNVRQKVDIKDIYRLRIANVVDSLIQDNWAFQERLNRLKVINSVTRSMLEKFTLKQFMAIKDSELQQRLQQRMAIESLYGLIADLSPEQIKVFNDAVARG